MEGKRDAAFFIPQMRLGLALHSQGFVAGAQARRKASLYIHKASLCFCISCM